MAHHSSKTLAKKIPKNANLFWHYNPIRAPYSRSISPVIPSANCAAGSRGPRALLLPTLSHDRLSLSLSHNTAAFEAQVRCGAVRCGRTDKTDSLLNSLQTWMLSCTTLPPPVFVSSSWTSFVEDLMQLEGGFWRRRCVSGLSSLFFELVNE
jgi:hypothetical protein